MHTLIFLQEPVFKHLPAQHCPLSTSRVGFSKWFGKESWNIKTGTKQICKKNHEWQTMEKNPEAPGFPVLYSGPSCSPVCISIPKSTTESSHQLPTFSRCTIFHILTFLNSGCTLTTHTFVVRAMIFCPNTLFRAKAPSPQVLGVGSPPAFPHRA